MPNQPELTDVSMNVFPPIEHIAMLSKQWEDGCGHDPCSYVGSVAIPPSKDRAGYPVDVYVFTEKHTGRQELCVRHGPEASAYSSPGTVLDVLIQASMFQDGYQRYVVALILAKMECRWTRRKP